MANELNALGQSLRFRVINFNTIWPAIFTAAVLFLLPLPAAAQSTLNFVRGIQNDDAMTGIAVTNTSPYFADIEFTFYASDGSPAQGVAVNPVSYRVAPRGQLAMLSQEIFGPGNAEGWIQARSSVSGLFGSYFSGNFGSTLDGSAAATPMSAQMIPFLPFQGDGVAASLVLTNPQPQAISGTLTLYSEQGEQAGAIPVRLGPYQQSTIPVSQAAAFISTEAPILATAVVATAQAIVFVNGQSVEEIASSRAVPYYTVGSHQPTLVLTNPSASPVVTTVSTIGGQGDAQPAPATFVVPAYGSVTADAALLGGPAIQAGFEGWLSIESASAPLTGMVVLESESSLTAIPMQAGASERMLFSQVSDADGFATRLTLVNPDAAAASVRVTLSRADGTTVAQRDASIPARSRLSQRLQEIIPEAATLTGGFLTVRSSTRLFGMETLGGADGSFLAAASPDTFPPAFVVPPPRAAVPNIRQLMPGLDVRPGMLLQVTVSNVGVNPSFVFGAQAVTGRPFPSSTTLFLVSVPQLDPGFVNFKVRSNGVESEPVRLRVLPPAGISVETLEGRAFYQKLEVTDGGLDLERPVMVPVRRARVEVVDNASQTVMSVAETDERGRFSALAPSGREVTVRVLSRLRAHELRVLDNTNLDALYAISTTVDVQGRPPEVMLTDTSRASGAFNILEVIQRGNDLLRVADERISPFPVTVYWSVRNTNTPGNIRNGLVGTTFFNFVNNTAYILGDRATDSDEYDDSVILHEYAHMLAARFSRDDSPGGPHGLGDLLDPRVAWSEGFANFFSSAARNSAVYRDSSGMDGSSVLRYDLESNAPEGDRPGYWSEHSVQSLLWDLFDDRDDDGDDVQFHFSLIWAAFRDLHHERFIYVPYFLERLLALQPEWTDSVRNMVQLRAIDFQPNQRPSVSNPFPRFIQPGSVVIGAVDSLSPQRSNLMQSAHFFSFTTPGGMTSIRMDIVGLGPGNNPGANDLDLFLLDQTGGVIQRSDRGLNGRSELITTHLPAGTYVIEVRSYYRQAETNNVVFNSGAYRLGLLIQ